MVWQSRRTPLRVLVAVLATALGAVASATPPSMNPELRDAMTATLNAGNTAPGRERPFSMVIRGGVSLGAYEAGVNWALLRLLKDLRDDPETTIEPTLYAAAGASAGAVNGFLAGLIWCTERPAAGTGPDTLNDNLFRNTWRHIDINELLKHAPLDEQLDEDKAGFSRAAMRQVETDVRNDIDRRRFTPSCEVGFGVSLTRDKPVLFTNAGVDVGQQRLLLPMRLRGLDTGGLDIRHFDGIDPPNFDNPGPEDLRERAFRSSVIYIDDGASDRIEDGPISLTAVFDAVKASSAFPVAFSPMKLSYCLFQNERQRAVTPGRGQYPTVGDPRGRCPDGYRRLSSRFVDGGVFDNDPVQLVRELSELRMRGATDTVRYIKVDPVKRRPARDTFQFEIAQFAEPGDSLDLVLWAARPTLSSQNPPQTRIKVRQCFQASSAPPVDHTLELVENAPNSLLFVGTIDTLVDADGLRQRTDVNAPIVVEPGDRLVPFHPDEPFEPLCDPGAAPASAPGGPVAALAERSDREQKTRNRTIAIVGEPPEGMSTQLGFLGGSVSSARGYRLYDELMRNDWRDGTLPNLPATALPLLQPTRLTTLTGDFLFSFAAFLDVRFRDYDYYAGVYDAVYGAAELTCLEDNDGYDGIGDCRAERSRLAYLQLCSPGAATMAACRQSAPAANTVMYHLAKLEQCGAAAILDANRSCDLGDWAWTEALVAGLAPSELAAVGRALQAAASDTRDNGRDPFVSFIRELADPKNGFTPGQSPVLNRMLALSTRPVPTWFYPLADSMIPQLIALEKADVDIRESNGIETAPGSSLLLPALAVGGLAAETAMAERTGWLPDQTAVPQNTKRRWLASILPAEVAVDGRNGGLALYLNPAWRRASGNYEVDFRVAPWLRQRFDNETIEFSEVSALVTRRFANPLFSSVGVGPTYTYTWTNEPAAREHNLGATVSAGLAADKIRLSYGVRSFDSSDFAGDDVFLHIGINDLPGLAYWVCQGNDEVWGLSAVCGVFD
ncbi:MAG: patatin-like phospholipase family protein [Pseudomonadota bacterium]